MIKRAGSSFGHIDIDYRLRPIFDRAVSEFIEADAEDKRLEREYEATANHTMVPSMFTTAFRWQEAAVVVLTIGGALIEQMLYHYATTFLDADWYSERLDRKPLLYKWRLIPRLCQKKRISKQDPAMNALSEFIAARNAVVHPKRKVMGRNPIRAHQRADKESARFASACRKAASTVNALIKLLESPPPST